MASRAHLKTMRQPCHRRQKPQPVLFIRKDRFRLIVAIVDVVDRPCLLNSDFSYHAIENPPPSTELSILWTAPFTTSI